MTVKYLIQKEFLQILRSCYFTARQNHTVRIQHAPGTLIVDPINTEFFL